MTDDCGNGMVTPAEMVVTDDIVTRLRGETPVQTRPCIRGGCCEVCESILDSTDEAADEIERLRKDMAELLEITKLFADWGECRQIDTQVGICLHSNCDWHDAEHMWESFCMRRGL